MCPMRAKHLKRQAPDTSIEAVERTLVRLDKLSEIPCFRALGERDERSLIAVARCVGNDDAYWKALKRKKKHDPHVEDRKLLLAAAWKEAGT